MYRRFFKRFLDVILSLVAMIVLSPVMTVLIAVGAVAMKGNPFFTQQRPGRIDKRTGREKIFRLVKLRTMTCEKDKSGELLPDEKRLTKYGKTLRSLSLDELPELWNIFVGDMSIVGPRPLLVKYLPLYSEEQRHRHDVRPGLTGLAQSSGRNAITWEQRFALDVTYVRDITFMGDVRIILNTVKAVFKKDGISSETSATMEEFKGSANIEINKV